MTQYIKFTYVDKLTEQPVSKQPARNGQTLPNITGLNYEFALQSKWPVLNTHPELFGTCPDSSNIDIAAVLQQITQTEYDEIKQQELGARKIQYRERINQLRDQYIAQGMSYNFSDGTTGTVQLRDLKDMSNIQSLSTNGLKLKVVGDTTTTIPFRDTENIQHMLTGDELVDMGEKAVQFSQSYYIVAWNHKDAIEAIGNLSDLENYNINTNWE